MEIAAHIKPITDKLTGLEMSLRSLWRNGDKSGPPGYMEVARDEDRIREDKRDRQITTILGEIRDLRDKAIRAEGHSGGEGEARVNRHEEFTRWISIGTLLVALAALILSLIFSLIHH